MQANLDQQRLLGFELELANSLEGHFAFVLRVIPPFQHSSPVAKNIIKRDVI